jgi:hypothetical protein
MRCGTREATANANDRQRALRTLPEDYAFGLGREAGSLSANNRRTQRAARLNGWERRQAPTRPDGALSGGPVP